MTRFYVALALCLAATTAHAQTIDEILALTKAGLGEDTIRAQIEATGTRYTLDAAQLVALKEGGVPESLIQAMIRTRGNVTAAGTPAARDAEAPFAQRSGDPALDRQIDEVRAALREPRYDLDRWNHPRSWYWDDDGLYGGFPYGGSCYGGYGYGYPVLGSIHLAPFGRSYGGTYSGSYSPGFSYHHGNFGFSFGTNFSGGGGSSFRFRFR